MWTWQNAVTHHDIVLQIVYWVQMWVELHEEVLQRQRLTLLQGRHAVIKLGAGIDTETRLRGKTDRVRDFIMMA